MEHIVVSNICHYLDRYDILADAQYGFRNKRSCESQFVRFTQSLFNSLSNSGQVDTIVLDFSKAFDKVHHEIFISKLDFYGKKETYTGELKRFYLTKYKRLC